MDVKDIQLAVIRAYNKAKAYVDPLLAGKADLVDGKVPSNQLPSYVDDIVEGYYYDGAFYEDSAHTTLLVGEKGKIYLDLATDDTYRWTGSAYTMVNQHDISGKADKVSSATNGHLAGLDSTGNLTDSGKSLSDIAAKTVTGTITANTENGSATVTYGATKILVAYRALDASTGEIVITNTVVNKTAGTVTFSIVGTYANAITCEVMYREALS